MEIHCNEPDVCIKFQLDPSMLPHFIAIFLSVRKDKQDKKRRNLNETLGARILKTAEAISVIFGM